MVLIQQFAKKEAEDMGGYSSASFLTASPLAASRLIWVSQQNLRSELIQAPGQEAPVCEPPLYRHM